jgi:hypothetical protein
MAQVTGALSGRASKIEYSTNYSTYTDLSGGANSIDISGGERMSGEAYTFDGDVAIITVGKLQPLEITMKQIYVASSTGHWATISALANAATPCNVRWNHTSTATTGDWRFTAATGYVITCNPPNAAADSGDPLTFEWMFKCPSVGAAVVA